jgi:hypothetical protein
MKIICKNKFNKKFLIPHLSALMILQDGNKQLCKAEAKVIGNGRCLPKKL